MDWLQKIKALNETDLQAKEQATTESELSLWRWFVLEADRVYRSSPKAADSWNLHKQHRKAAADLCKAGDISAARAEFDKALEALKGAALTQHELF